MKTRNLKKTASQSAFEVLTEKEMNSVNGGGLVMYTRIDENGHPVISFKIVP